MATHHLAKATIDAMAGTQKTHFLNPDGRRLNKSLGDATGLTRLGVHLVELPPGAESSEQHRHHQEEEAVYVLDGRGEVLLDDEVHPVAPGDFVGLPAGGPAHVFRNTGEAPLVLLVIGQRLEFDVADYPRLGKRLYRHGTRWDLVDLAHIEDVKKTRPGVGRK